MSDFDAFLDHGSSTLLHFSYLLGRVHVPQWNRVKRKKNRVALIVTLKYSNYAEPELSIILKS